MLKKLDVALDALLVAFGMGAGFGLGLLFVFWTLGHVTISIGIK